MTLSSRHRIRNSSPGGLRPSTLPLGHGGSPQYWLSHVDGEETFFVSFKPPRPGTEPRTLAWQAAVLTTTPAQISSKILSTGHMTLYQRWINVYNDIDLTNVDQTLRAQCGILRVCLSPVYTFGRIITAIPVPCAPHETARKLSTVWANGELVFSVCYIPGKPDGYYGHIPVAVVRVHSMIII